MDNDMYLTP